MQALNLRAGGRAVHPISWYDLYHTGGPEALGDRSPRPDRVWNRIPDVVRDQIIKLALDEPTLSPRELAVRFTDAENYFEQVFSKLKHLLRKDAARIEAVCACIGKLLGAFTPQECANYFKNAGYNLT